MNLEITTWHGECGTLFYVIDRDTRGLDDVPDVLQTFHSRERAEDYIRNRTNNDEIAVALESLLDYQTQLLQEVERMPASKQGTQWHTDRLREIELNDKAIAWRREQIANRTKRGE